MEKDLRDLLYAMPPNTEYACDLSELDEEDIPKERLPRLVALLDGDDEVAFIAARVLCSWANEQGFNYMISFVFRDPPVNKGWYPHRLRGYDDTYRMALLSFQSYWATRATRSPAEGELARKKIFSPIVRLIELSNSMPFEVPLRFLVEKQGFFEYLPALKCHLQAILKHQDLHHWKVADCAHLLMNFDPDFVHETLAQCGKTLADFPLGY